MRRDDDILELVRRVDPLPDVNGLPTYVRGNDPVWHTIVARAASEVAGDVDTDVEHGRVEASNRRGRWRIGLVAAVEATVAALLVVTVPQRETRTWLRGSCSRRRLQAARARREPGGHPRK